MNQIVPYRTTQERTRHLTHVCQFFGDVFVSDLPSRYITLVNEVRDETSVKIAYRDRLSDAVGVR